MDPLSLLALAQTSFAALRAGISAGKELQGMAADLGSLFDSVAAITRAAAEPARGNLLAGKSAEQVAMEAYSAKAAADDLMNQLRNDFIGAFGLAAWDEVVAHTTRLKKEMRAAEVQAANERDELLNSITEFMLIAISIVVVIGLIVVTLMIILQR